MMPEQSVSEPTEYLIWGTTGLLALLLGVGASFVVWAALRRSADTVLVEAAVGMLGVGLLTIGLAVERPLTKLFLILFAVSLVLSFTFGGPEFARLLP